jgi:hypothetical protein
MDDRDCPGFTPGAALGDEGDIGAAARIAAGLLTIDIQGDGFLTIPAVPEAVHNLFILCAVNYY